jgi:hypothetical protein
VIGIVVAGVLLAIVQGKMDASFKGRVKVKNNVPNYLFGQTVREWSERGYDLTSDSTHTFGKHTLVFTRRPEKQGIHLTLGYSLPLQTKGRRAER